MGQARPANSPFFGRWGWFFWARGSWRAPVSHFFFNIKKWEKNHFFKKIWRIKTGRPAFGPPAGARAWVYFCTPFSKTGGRGWVGQRQGGLTRFDIPTREYSNLYQKNKYMFIVYLLSILLWFKFIKNKK